MAESLTPESRRTINRISNEQKRVVTQNKELEIAIKTVKAISLPCGLTLNNFQADVQLAKSHLSIRQRALLEKPIKQKAPIPVKNPRPLNAIELTYEE
jgi:hypothetical protein